MSNSPLPTEPGDLPTKVVLTGVAGSSDKALPLYERIAGEVSAFLSKARQNRLISGQQGAYMFQARPGGGSLRYQYNNGQETVFVVLTAPELEFTKEPEPPKPELIQPILAIDVVFEPSFYLSGDIYSHTSSIPGGAPPFNPDSNDLSKWTKTFITDLAGIQAWRTQVATAAGEAVTAFVLLQSGRYGGTPSYIDSHGWTGRNSPTGIPPEGPPFPFRIAYDWVYVRVDTRKDNPDGSFSTGSAGFVCVTNKYDAPPDNVQLNFRKKLSFYDCMTVVGLSSNDGKQTHLAFSTNTSSDKKLVSLVDKGATLNATRNVGVASPPPGFFGAGFVVKPREPNISPTIPMKKAVIDVFIVSLNVIKTNTFSGKIGSNYATDDPEFTYDYKRDLTFTIRAREFSDEGYAVVRVGTVVQGRTQDFFAPTDGADVQPTSDGGTVDAPDGREESWKFAAQKSWSDTGRSPADPKAKGMGDLLAEKGPITKTVAGAPPSLQRKTFRQPEWSGDTTGMTKVATIEWTPTTKRGQPGKAKITLV